MSKNHGSWEDKPLNSILSYEKIEYTQEYAKAEYDKCNYPIAKIIYEKLWEDSKKENTFLLSWYGRSLRKLGENKKFIDIYNELKGNHKIISNKFVIDILCWCIYDVYIKEYSFDDSEQFNDFITKAEFIKNYSSQLDADQSFINPYVVTIRKVVKTYKDKTTKNYKEIIKWLSYLNPDRLPVNDYKFIDETGKDRELASLKEFYYQNMAEAFEKTGQYEECIKICEKAFQQIKKLHYRNTIWLKARMYFSKCMAQNDTESAILEYKDLAYKENFWFMYHKLSQICFRYNKMPEALLYGSKAYGCIFEHEKMVNLFLDTALLWQAVGNNENAKVYFQASAYYRKRQSWPISEELKFAITSFEIDVEKKPNIYLLKDIAKKYVASIEVEKEKLKGTVIKILSHGGSGFIKPHESSNNVYFRANDVFDKKKLVVDDIVEYELEKSKDDRIRAIKIMKRG